MFQTTQWPDVVQARDGIGESRHEALDRLCRAYWPPLYSYAVKVGRTREDAQDSVQGFLLYFVDKGLIRRVDSDRGRLRNYLVAVFRKWLSNERRRDNCATRGGSVRLESFDVIHD